MKCVRLAIALANMLAIATLLGCGSDPANTVDVACGTSLTSISTASGTTVALQRGCAYGGTLLVKGSKVTVTAYGSGPDPVIALGHNGAAVNVLGSHDVVENLSLIGAAPSFWNCRGHRTPAGHVVGVNLTPGTARDTVQDVKATGFYAAVEVMAGSSFDIISHNNFTANDELSTNNHKSSSGGFGVLLRGDRNFVEYNTINNNQACSLAFGYDGSAVEVSGGSYNLIAWNKASNDNAFSELGSYPGSDATGNYYSHNTVTDGHDGLGVTFLITRGSGSPYGPVLNTRAFFNHVKLTRSGDEGAVSYAWRSGDGTLLTLAKNYLDLGQNVALFENGGYVNGGGNTFIGTCHPTTACGPKPHASHQRRGRPEA
jgi:hypothetical protein